MNSHLFISEMHDFTLKPN